MRVLEGLGAQVLGLVGAEGLHGELGVHVAQGGLLVPLQLEPGRVAQGQVEAALGGEDVRKLQLPVEEVLPGGDVAGYAHAGVHRAQPVDVHLAGDGHALLQLGDALLFGGAQVVPAVVVAQLEQRPLAHRIARHLDRRGHRALQDEAHVEQELVAARQLLRLLDGPEPQGAPVVHGKLEARVGARVALVLREVVPRVDGVLLADGVVRGLGRVGVAPQLQDVARLALHAPLLLHLPGPQVVHRAREPPQALDLALLVGPLQLLAPGLHLLEGLRLQLAHRLVVVGAHGRVAHEKVVHAVALGAARLVAYALGLLVEPAKVLIGGRELALGVAAPARPHQRVAAVQLVAEPRHEAVAADGVQPQRHLSQLHGYGVEVHAVHVAVGDVHLHALQLVVALLGRHRAAQLGLAQAQVGLGQLADGLVQEGGAAHGGLYHLEVEHLGGRLAGQQLLQGVAHQAAREALGGVVARARLALAARQAVDELALAVHAQVALPGARLVAHALALVVVVELGGGHEVAHVQLVEGVVGALHLVEVLAGDEAAVGEQRLVHAAQLVDAQGGVADALAAALAVGARHAHEVHDARRHAVAQAGVADVGRVVLLVEDVGLERGHQEHVVVGGPGSGKAAHLLVGEGVAVVHQVEQAVERLVDVVGVAGGVQVVAQVGHQVAQGLEGVALEVGVAAHGGEAQLGARLHEEQEEDAVHVAQALGGELPGIKLGHVAALVVHPVPDHLVAQQLHALAQGVLERARHLGGAAARLRVELVDERGALGAQARMGQQRGGGLLLLAGQHLAHVELQAASLAPLVAVAQQHVPHGEHEHEARRLGRAEEEAVDKRLQRVVVPASMGARGGDEARAQRLGGEHPRVGVAGLQGQHGPHLRGAALPQVLAPHGGGRAVLQGHLGPGVLLGRAGGVGAGRGGGGLGVAQGSHEPACRLGAERAAARLAGGLVEGGTRPGVGLAQAAQLGGGVGALPALGLVLPCVHPALYRGLEVLGQVVLGEELVAVGDARQVDAHRAAPMMTARILMFGLFWMRRVSVTHVS